MRHIHKAIAVGAAVGVLGLGGAAYASTTGSSASPASKPAKAKSIHHWLMSRAIYAEVIVEGKGHTTHTFVVERGTFTGISGGDIHLTRPDGVAVSAPVTATTKFAHIPEASLVAGDRVRIIERDGTLLRVVGFAPKHAPVPATPAG
jgi:hypothetical protein